MKGSRIISAIIIGLAIILSASIYVGSITFSEAMATFIDWIFWIIVIILVILGIIFAVVIIGAVVSALLEK